MFSAAQKKEMKRNILYIAFILFIAVLSTHFIYYHFQDNRNIDFNSESLDVTFHEETGNKLTISKIIPVTDSVGLSSKSYLISISNNLTEKVDYTIHILDDEEIIQDLNPENAIPKDDIRISIKVSRKETKIYTLGDLEDGLLIEDTMDALEEKNVSIRIWIKQDSNLSGKNDMYYHGLMKVTEEKHDYTKDEENGN